MADASLCSDLDVLIETARVFWSQAALLLLAPWLCIARPLPLEKTSSVGERASFLLLAVLSPYTLVCVAAGLAWAGGGAWLLGLLHGTAGPASAARPRVLGALVGSEWKAQSVGRLLAASPALSALLFGVWAPSWLACAAIAAAPSDRRHQAQLAVHDSVRPC